MPTPGHLGVSSPLSAGSVCPLLCWSSTPVTRSQRGGSCLNIPLRGAKLHFWVFGYKRGSWFGSAETPLLNFLFLLTHNRLSSHSCAHQHTLSTKNSKLWKVKGQLVHCTLCPAKSRTPYSMWWVWRREYSLRIFYFVLQPPLPNSPPPTHPQSICEAWILT